MVCSSWVFCEQETGSPCLYNDVLRFIILYQRLTNWMSMISVNPNVLDWAEFHHFIVSSGKCSIFALYFSKVPSRENHTFQFVPEKKKRCPEGILHHTSACERNSIGIFFPHPLKRAITFTANPLWRKGLTLIFISKVKYDKKGF